MPKRATGTKRPQPRDPGPQTSKTIDIISIGSKRRHIALLEKLNAGGTLSQRELTELRGYEGKRDPKSPGVYDEKTADRQRHAKKRARARDIVIDFSRQDMKRRTKGEKDPAFFLKIYFPHIFYLPFSPNQKHNITELDRIMRHGGMKAIAAPRASGKTSITKCMVIRGLVYNLIKWIPWIEANLEMAMDTLEDLASFFADPRGDDLFGADFPEYCTPIRLLEGEAQRARRQTYKGKSTKIRWGIKRIILPTIAADSTPNGTPATGGIIQAFGAEKAIRGLVRQEKRPDFVGINDIETEETARSLTQTHNILKNITKAIQGLAAPGKRISIGILCTIIRKGCVADQLTDLKKYPQWSGERQMMVEKMPTNLEMWERYIYLRQKEQRQLGEDRKDRGIYRIADNYYRRNRRAMDAGCVVNNRHRYNKENGADRKPVEISAIHGVLNIIADHTWEYFFCECQNQPTEEIAGAAQIDKTIIEAKVNGFDRGVIPPGCEKIILCADPHDTRLFWGVVAWKPGLTGYVIDYGAERVLSPMAGTVSQKEKKEQVEIAITEAISRFRNQIEARGGWPSADTGEMTNLNIALVDAGYLPEAIYAGCRRSAGGIWRPSMGASGRTGRYRTPKPSETIKGVGAGHHKSWQPKSRIWLTVIDPDKYKKRCQDGFLAPAIDSPGSISLFGDDPGQHRAFAEHIAAEAWNETKSKYESVPGSRQNHWLDIIAGCCAGAEIAGLHLQAVPAPRRKGKKKKRYRRMVDPPRYRT